MNLPCHVGGCPRPRARWGRHCVRHARALTLHGAPTARIIPTKDLKLYALKTLELFEEFPGHAGVGIATAELTDSLSDSLRRVRAGEKADPCVVQFARLAGDYVEARHILSMQCAVSLFERDHPNHVVDHAAHTYAVARAVCLLSPRSRGKARRAPLSAKALAQIGTFLTDRYSTLAGAVVFHFDRQERAERSRAEMLRQPFATINPNNERIP